MNTIKIDNNCKTKFINEKRKNIVQNKQEEKNYEK